MKKEYILLSLLILSLFFSFFIISTFKIAQSVVGMCTIAKEQYSGECVDALSALLVDETASLKSRNGAIWALGQLCDPKAYEVLKRYHTGEPCEHNKHPCQYELEKALSYYENNFNVVHLLWGWMYP